MTDLNCFNITIINSFFDEKFGANYSSLPLTSHNIQLHNESNESYHQNNNYQQEEEDSVQIVSRGIVGFHPCHNKGSFNQQTNRTCWLVFCSALLTASLVLGQTPHDNKAGGQTECLGLTVAVKMSGRSLSPGEQSWLELQPEEMTAKSDVEIVGLGSDWEDALVEKIEVVCCDQIQVRSEGLLASLFPGIPGNYSKLVESSSSPVWKHQSAPLYISKPHAKKKVRQSAWLPGLKYFCQSYSWGVTKVPEARWGYLRSHFGGVCPTLGGRWTVYDQNIKRWRIDKTLVIFCR